MKIRVVVPFMNETDPLSMKIRVVTHFMKETKSSHALYEETKSSHTLYGGN